MAKLIINELSLERENTATPRLNQQLIELVELINSERIARDTIKCSRNTLNQVVSNDKTLVSHIQSSFSRDRRLQLMSWLANGGPFWDDQRAKVEFDSFNHDDLEVTEHGLGEAGRLSSLGVSVLSFSFEGSTKNFHRTPLPISHSLEEIKLGEYKIENIWNVSNISERIKLSTPEISSWKELLEFAKDSFANLIFLQNPHTDLIPIPFSQGASHRILFLLKTLDQLSEHTNQDGSYSEEAHKIYDLHFKGDKAAFSDESAQNKIDFKNEMTFQDNDGNSTFAPYHGKVNTPKLRVHYEWPRPDKQKNIKILYIGPKITKR